KFDDHIKVKREKQLLGKGAMGKGVYVYEDDPNVAVKKSHPSQRQSFGRDIYKKEYEMGKRMDHPVLAKTYDMKSKEKNGMIKHKLMIEKIEGVNIYKSHLTKEQAIKLIEDAKSCCLYLLQQRIIWKDVNDGNIFITPEGHLKICDFGLWIDHKESMAERVGLSPEFEKQHDLKKPPIGVELLGGAVEVVGWILHGAGISPGNTQRGDILFPKAFFGDIQDPPHQVITFHDVTDQPW